MERLSVGKEKVGLIIGKKGFTKKLLEGELGVKLKIFRNGDIIIEGETMHSYLALQVTQAISFGFSVEQALNLKNQDFVFETVSLKEFAKSKQRLTDIKARLIGKQGKVKNTIQQLGEISLCIVENKIGIIGRVEDVHSAKQAISALLRGAKHARIYKWLEHKRRARKFTK